MWLIGLLACNGVPELESEATLNSLEAQEREQLCEQYAIQDPVDKACTLVDVSVEPLDTDTCQARWIPDGCTATVGEWVACQEAITEDPCALVERHSACRPLEECGVHLWAAGLGLDGEVELAELAGDEVEATCAAGNDFETVDVSCVDFLDPLPFAPDEQGCMDQIDDGICGTIADYLDCQIAILDEVEALICRQEAVEACEPLVCF